MAFVWTAVFGMNKVWKTLVTELGSPVTHMQVPLLPML